MATIDKLVGQIGDGELRTKMASEIAAMKKRTSWGLVFERHLPENTRLLVAPIRVGTAVWERRLADPRRFRVRAIENDEFVVVPEPAGTTAAADAPTERLARDNVLVEHDFAQPIFPTVTPIGAVRNGPPDKPSHVVVEGENFHALQALLVAYEGQVDALYLDPPYNTGDRDWSYNNDYVDPNDEYRPSKWLAFMERRLHIARRLLKPDGVMVVTIHEEEVHHLGMLLEQMFPGHNIQMVTAVINPKGVTQGGLSRVDEYLFFVTPPGLALEGRGDDMLTPGTTDEDESLIEPGGSVRWQGLLHSGQGARRQDRQTMFYPVLIDEERGAVVGAGEPLLEGDPDLDATIDGHTAVWPIRSNGTWGRWYVSHTTLRQFIAQGYVALGGHNEGRRTWALSYPYRKIREQVAAGVIEITNFDERRNVVQMRYADVGARRIKTVWHRTRHDAGAYGADGSDHFGVEPVPGAVFLWLTDMPDLNVQTQTKMHDAASDLRMSRLPIIPTTWNEPELSAGHCYFLNTQKLSKRTDLVKSGPSVGRTFTFWDVVTRTIENPDKMLYLVVDEAHRGMTETADVTEANSIVQRFIKGYPEADMLAVPVLLGISATPARFADVIAGTGWGSLTHNVPPGEVRESGLIKDEVLAEYGNARQGDAMALFPDAVTAWRDASRDWATYHEQYGGEELVVPALIVQVENEGGGRVTRTDLEAVLATITEIAGPLPENAFAHSFSGSKLPAPAGGRTIRYIDPPSIAGDTDARVVFFKTSLGTGWDCPRAEVLFSFRRAVDPTSIAQTIGRMVRTPLARRIAENEDLNSAHVFLPHFDADAVKSIVDYLNATGNQAVAGAIKPRRESVSLPLRSDMPEVVEVLKQVPSAIVPTSVTRTKIRVLADLASFLSKTGLEPTAFAREMRDAAAVLVAQRDALADDEAFAAEVSNEAYVTFYQAELLAGETEVGERQVPVSEESLSRIWGVAERKFTGEVAKVFVRLRLAADADALAVARREAYALTRQTRATDALNAHAGARLDALRQQWGVAVEGLTPAQQARYGNIVRRAPDPTTDHVKLADTAVFARGETDYQRHLYADSDGNAPLWFGSSWETHVIDEELARPGCRAWLRNVDRADGALTVARDDNNRWRPFYPDFLFVREADERLVVDIVDPHDHSRNDAISKAKGLSRYASDHADSVVHHVDIVAKIAGTFRRLHLERSAIREQVDALGDNTDELESLYTREG